MAKAKDMDCFFCGNLVDGVGHDTVAVLCSTCTSRLTGVPEEKPQVQRLPYEERKARKEARQAKKLAKLEQKKSAKRGRGRGWHLKKLYEEDGKFYSFGKEIDASTVVKLKKELKLNA